MKFFKERESTAVRKIRASRAVYVQPEVSRVDIEFENEDGVRLTLELTPQQARQLIGDMACAYEAINPPLHRGITAAGWLGME